MEILQEQLDFQGTRTVQRIVPKAEQHVNLKIKASKIDNVLSTAHRYKQTFTSVKVTSQQAKNRKKVTLKKLVV